MRKSRRTRSWCGTSARPFLLIDGGQEGWQLAQGRRQTWLRIQILMELARIADFDTMKAHWQEHGLLVCTHRNASRREIEEPGRDSEMSSGVVTTIHHCPDCGQRVYRLHPRPVPRIFLIEPREHQHAAP